MVFDELPRRDAAAVPPDARSATAHVPPRVLRAVPVPPIVITCAENDPVALVGLRHGTCAESPGVDDDLRFLVTRIRQRWPDVEIVVRGDSGFGLPLIYDVCEELRVTYTLGLAMNARLKRLSDE